MDKINTPCTSACMKMNQEFAERIDSLEQKVRFLAQQLRELEEIREEMLMEIRGDAIESENDEEKEQEQITLPHVSEDDFDDSGQASYGINVEEQQNNYKSSFGDVTGSQDKINDELVFRSSTPCLVIDEEIPLDLSSSQKNPGCFLNDSADLRVEISTDEHEMNNQIDGNWTSLDEKEVSLQDATDRAERDDQHVGTSEPDIKKQKLASGGVNAIAPVDVFPESPLMCTKCSAVKGFATKGGLTRHTKTFHSEERQFFQCGKCDRTFVYKEGMKYHISSVHERIRFLCGAPKCGSFYARITALRQHQKKVGHDSGSIKIRINQGS